MKKSFLKLIAGNMILYFGVVLLFNISHYYAIEDSNSSILKNSSENTSNSADNNNSDTSGIISDDDKKVDEQSNITNIQEKTDDSESEVQNTEKPVENKEIKNLKKKTNIQETKDKEKETKQVLLPEISFEDLDLDHSEKIENLRQKDNSDKILKGVVSWGLILLGIALIIFVIVNNKKIPSNIDIKTCNKHDTKYKGEKKYYKNIQRRG